MECYLCSKGKISFKESLANGSLDCQHLAIPPFSSFFFFLLLLFSFPNFGHWRLRLQILPSGRMPMNTVWHTPWYETPNIHPCTIQDFLELCESEGYVIDRWLAIDEAGERAPWRRSIRLANLFGEQALFLLRKR